MKLKQIYLFLKHLLLNKWTVRLVGIITFVFILSVIDIKATWLVLSKANMLYILLAIGITLVGILSLTWRWDYLLKSQNIHYPISSILLMQTVVPLAVMVVPEGLGTLVKSLYLKRDGYSWGKSLFSVVIEKSADLGLVFLWGGIGLAFLLSNRQVFYITIGITIVSIAVVFALTLTKPSQLERIMLSFIPKKFRHLIANSARDFYIDLYTLCHLDKLFIVSLQTLVFRILYFVSVYFLALSLSIPISFWSLASVISVVTVVSFIPISIAGIGTRDVSLLALFSVLKISKESAIAFSTLVLLLIVSNAIFGLGAWLLKPLDIKRESLE